MSDFGEFDDIFGDVWGDEQFAHIFANQRNMERAFREYVKNLIESLKKGKLEGKSEFIPIEGPGVRGFVFRREFVNPHISEEKGTGHAIAGETEKENQEFALHDTTDDAERAPTFETFIEGDEFVALVELPGAGEQDIDLKIGENLIEVGALNFKTARISVPMNADASKASKTYKNGILEIRIPLASEARLDEEPRFGIA